jgi:excisionase family DNA binding protein
MTKLLNGNEVAEVLHISRTQAYRLMRSQELKTVRFGRLVRVRSEDLAQFIQQHLEG